jgi:hypothetical protein
MENENFKVEFELGSGEIVKMTVEKAEYWDEIPKGKRALICLVDGQQLYATIDSACEDECVTFNTCQGSRSMHYDAVVVSEILTEV